MMPRAIPLGVYISGNSLIHRLKPGFKMIFLLLFIILSAFFVHSPYIAVGLVIFSISCYVIARIPIKVAWAQLKFPICIFLVLFAFQWWRQDLSIALTLVFTLFSAIMMANLFTLTTSLDAMMDALDDWLRPLARIGVPTDQISLLVSLTLRLIPLMLSTISEVLQARKARGVEFSLVAFGTPVIIRSIRRAQNIADALLARGADD